MAEDQATETQRLLEPDLLVFTGVGMEHCSSQGHWEDQTVEGEQEADHAERSDNHVYQSKHPKYRHDRCADGKEVVTPSLVVCGDEGPGPHSDKQGEQESCQEPEHRTDVAEDDTGLKGLRV